MSDPSTLFVSLMVSVVGLAIFIYGKRQQRFPQLVAGVALMAFPFFLSNAWVQVAVAAGIGGLLWFAVRVGL
jgi:predicted phage tail protein